MGDFPHVFTQEEKSRGGSVKGETKRAGNLKSKSRIAKCKNCPLECVYKNEQIKLSSNSVCVCSELRANALINDIPIVGLKINQLDGKILELLDVFTEEYKQAKKAYEDDKTKQTRMDLMVAKNMLWARTESIWKQMKPQQIEQTNVNITLSPEIIAKRILDMKLKEIGIEKIEKIKEKKEDKKNVSG